MTFRAADGPVALAEVTVPSEPTGVPVKHADQPLVEVTGLRWGMTAADISGPMSGSQIGSQLRYRSHRVAVDNGIHSLAITQDDPASGLRATSYFSARDGVAAVTSTTHLSLIPGRAPLVVTAVTSFAASVPLAGGADDLVVWRGESGWASEARWAPTRLRSHGLAPSQPGERRRSAVSATSLGSWSAGMFVPAGAVEHTPSGRTFAWQVEHNGAWHWDVGERGGAGSTEPVQAYVSVTGPTDLHHQWTATITDAVGFTTVPVTVSVGSSFAAAFGHLADHRRAARRDHEQFRSLPVVFNDWMNTLEGRGTEQNLLPLVDAAGAIGAEYFCIDAGWYHDDEDPSAWWHTVGDWQPSTTRFPHGLRRVADHIRERGMVPGIWLEPEVVAVRAAAARMLPDSAFVRRTGARTVSHDRHLLDFRDPAAVAHVDAAVDRLVAELGIGYFKFDYNTTIGPGIDTPGEPLGVGLLEHNRALLSWLDSITARHPDVIFESCASGGLRSDFATLSRLQLQSTSDQTNPLLYPAIAVGSLVHIVPEQAGNWTYPQPGMSPDMIAFCMATGMAGRMYHAGRVDKMTADELELVKEGVAVHKSIRGEIALSTPRFPTGLPTWNDEWVSVAFDLPELSYLIVWRIADSAGQLDLNLDFDRSSSVEIDQIYPMTDDGTWSVSKNHRGVRIRAAAGPSARMFRVRPAAR
jgi:alpha-galactosidase